eukprot:6828507-Ditylum_brightwellii.AAC.1
MDAKLQAHQKHNTAVAKKNKEFLKEILSRIFAAMTNMKDTTKSHNNQNFSLQDYTKKDNGKRQKHRVDKYDLDSEMDKTDALRDERDALAPDQDGQGGF